MVILTKRSPSLQGYLIMRLLAGDLARWSRLRILWIIALLMMANLVFAATDCTYPVPQSDIPQAECEALVALYNDTGGSGWTDAATNNWNVTNTPCSWTGITCDTSSPKHVTEITRVNQNLQGSIPNLNNLTYLQMLYLNGNQLGDTIPDFSGLSNLTILNLGNNQFTGNINPLFLPSSLGGLYLEGNSLTGAIPNFTNTPSLQILFLQENQLSGTIPDLTPLTGLWVLFLRDNRLSGIIPNLPSGLDPSWTDFGYNTLTGETGGSATVKDPDWANTQTVAPTGLSATVLSPTSIQINWTPIAYTADGGYYQIKYATTSGGPYTNATTTTVDKTASSYVVTDLSPGIPYYLVVETFTPAHTPQQNDLTSALSQEVSATTSTTDCTPPAQTEIPQAECQALVDFYNSTNGPGWYDTPANNWNVTNTPCSWTGITCTGNNVFTLVEDTNNLVGTLPPSLGNLTSLQGLILSSNQLTGPIPTSLPASLQSLDLFNNQLTGPIPTSLPVSLQELTLSSNQLTGPIPTSLPASLQHLSLGINQLTGPIPTSLPASLQSLHLFNNQLTGPIPTSLPASLQWLDLFNNQLSGTIPDLSTLIDLWAVDLSCNRLTGETNGSATALDPDWATTQCFPPPVTPFPGYGSPPLPDTIIDVGTSLVGTPVTTDLALSEVGNAPLIVGFTAINGTHATDFKVNTSLFPLTIADGGAAVPVTLTCTPSAAGVRTATLELTSNDPNYPTIRYSLSCNGILPGYQSTPAPNSPLKIGEALVNTSISQSLTVTEQGVGNLTVSNPVITGKNASDFTVITPLFPFTITDNSNVVRTIRVRCIPSELGLRTATLELTSNDPNNPKPTYPLECTGLTLVAGYKATQPTTEILDFGSQPVGVAVTRSFDISETGNADLTVELLGLERDPHELADFEILSPPFPITLANGSNPVTVTIQCKPAAVGSHYAQLKLATNDPLNPTLAYTLNCIGEAVTPAYDSMPHPNDTLIFSGLTNHTATLTISEVGTGTLTITDPKFIDDLAQNFSITTDVPPLTLADGAAPQTIILQCTPDGTHKVMTATLQLTTNDANQPLVNYPLVCVDVHKNHAPTDILLSNHIIQQESAIETVIGSLATIDLVDMKDVLTTPTPPLQGGAGVVICSTCHDASKATTPSPHIYSLIDNANGLFKLVDNQLLLAQPLSSTTTSYPIVVRSTDASGLFLDKTFMIEIVIAPMAEAVYSSSPAPKGVVHFNFTTFDTPVQSQLVITNDGNRDLQVDFGEINGAQANNFRLVTPVFPLNLAGQSSQTITLSCTPSESGLSVAILVLHSSDELMPTPIYSLLCTPEKSGPVYQSLPLPNSILDIGSSPLGQPIETNLNIIEGGNETLSVSQAVITGLDAAYFNISETPFSIEDGEQPHALKVQCTPHIVGQQVAHLILATNDPLQSAVNYDLTCTGLSLSPSVDINLSNNSIDENVPGDTFIGRITTTDSDPQEHHQYVLVNDPKGQFVVIGDGLYTAPTAVFDVAVQNSYPIVIRSINSMESSFTKDFMIFINEVPKAKILGQILTEFGDQGNYVTIDTPERMTLSAVIEPPPEHLGQSAKIVMTVHWTPLDCGKPLTVIRPSHQTLSEHLQLILYKGSLFGLTGTFHLDLSYQLDDGVKISATNIAVLQIRRNRPPTAITLSAHRVDEDSPPETVVGLLSATDPDKGEQFTYDISNNPGGYFMVVGNELRRAYSFPLRFAKTDQHHLTIRAIDIAGSSVSQKFTVFVNDQ